MQIAAIAAPPHDFLWSFEHKVVLDVLSQVEISFLMLFLGHRDGFEHGDDFRESFITRHLREPRIHGGPFVILTTGARLQILDGRFNHAGREGGRDFCLSTLEELEEPLGMFPFLIGRFLEDGLDLHVALLLRLGCEVGVAVAGLRFSGKSGQQVLLGLRSL